MGSNRTQSQTLVKLTLLPAHKVLLCVRVGNPARFRSEAAQRGGRQELVVETGVVGQASLGASPLLGWTGGDKVELQPGLLLLFVAVEVEHLAIRG